MTIGGKKAGFKICLPLCLLSLSEDRQAAKHTVLEVGSWSTMLIQTLA